MIEILTKRTLAASACILLVLAAAGGAAQAAPVKLKTGIPAYYEGFLPVYTALEKGYFKDVGLDVDITTFKGGGAAGQAFIAGAIDLCLCSFDHVLKMQSRGLAAVAIGGIEEYNAYALIARKDSVPPGLANLRGKKIGITSPGSSTDILMRYEMKRAGIDPKEVSLISIGGATAMKAALENGQIDAGMVIGGILVDMLHEGGWEIIEDFRTHRYPLEVVIARKEWLKDNAAIAKQFLTALARAQKLLQEDAEVAYQVTKTMFPKMADPIVRGVSEAAVRRLSPDGSIDREGADAIVDQQVFAGAIPKSVPYEALVDLSYLSKTTP